VTLILFRDDVTSDVHLLDFNKRILILKMHGANIKIILNVLEDRHISDPCCNSNYVSSDVHAIA
jgi:hypothetical protein